MSEIDCRQIVHGWNDVLPDNVVGRAYVVDIAAVSQCRTFERLIQGEVVEGAQDRLTFRVTIGNVLRRGDEVIVR